MVEGFAGSDLPGAGDAPQAQTSNMLIATSNECANRGRIMSAYVHRKLEFVMKKIAAVDDCKSTIPRIVFTE